MSKPTRKELLDHLLQDGLVTNEDFEKAIAKFLEYLESTHDGNKKEIAALSSSIADALTEFKRINEEDREAFKGDLSQTDTQRAAQAEIRLNEAISKLDARIATIQDGKDADEETILGRLTERLPKIEEIENKLPALGERIRDALELLVDEQRLKIEAIDGLREELDALKKKSSGGGAVALPVSHWPIHETFTMDGVATTVTLQQAPAAQGTAIFGVRYQGQTLDMTTHYTVNGNKITLVEITPSSGDIISISYMP